MAKKKSPKASWQYLNLAELIQFLPTNGPDKEANKKANLGLSSAHKLLVCLASKANDGGKVYHGYQSLMLRSDIHSQTTLKSTIDYLCRIGLLAYESKASGKGTNLYQLNLEAMKALILKQGWFNLEGKQIRFWNDSEAKDPPTVGVCPVIDDSPMIGGCPSENGSPTIGRDTSTSQNGSPTGLKGSPTAGLDSPTIGFDTPTIGDEPTDKATHRNQPPAEQPTDKATHRNQPTSKLDFSEALETEETGLLENTDQMSQRCDTVPAQPLTIDLCSDCGNQPVPEINTGEAQDHQSRAAGSVPPRDAKTMVSSPQTVVNLPSNKTDHPPSPLKPTRSVISAPPAKKMCLNCDLFTNFSIRGDGGVMCERCRLALNAQDEFVIQIQTPEQPLKETVTT